MALMRIRQADGSMIELPTIVGKNAYEYAVEGGYSGTEEEFAAKLAAEFLPSEGGNITGDLTAAGSVTANSFALDIGATLKVESAAILLEAPSGRPITIRPYANKTHGVSFSSSYMFPETTDKLSLGKSTRKFKNLYLVGNITDGTNTVAVSDIAKKSDIPEIPESDDVIVTFTQTSDAMLSADKTYAVVLAAIQAGKHVVGKVVYASEGQNRIQYARNVLVDTANKRIVFSGLDEMTDREVMLREDDRVVSFEDLHHNSHPTAHQDIRDALAAHTENKNNTHGVTLAQLGVTASAAELNYVDGVTGNIQTQLNAKAADYSIELYNGTSGNPKPVKFATVDYTTCGSENGVAVKISMVSGHGNGTSYAFMQDAIIRVSYLGKVEVDNLKVYGAATGTYDGAARQYGDIFWVHDTENKVVDFYCLMGQYARVNMTPFKRVTYSTGGTITQHKTASVYSSGTIEWANNEEIATKSDIPTAVATSTTNGLMSAADKATLDALAASAVSVLSGTAAPTADIGEDGDIYLVTEG